MPVSKTCRRSSLADCSSQMSRAGRCKSSMNSLRVLLFFAPYTFPVQGRVMGLKVLQGSGIGKMKDNSTSADLLSYTTNGSRGGLVI